MIREVREAYRALTKLSDCYADIDHWCYVSADYNEELRCGIDREDVFGLPLVCRRGGGVALTWRHRLGMDGLCPVID